MALGPIGRYLSTCTLTFGMAFNPLAAAASTACNSDAMIVFDGSASMSEPGTSGTGRSRIKEARDAVGRAMPFIAPFRKVGLIVYGPNPNTNEAGSCDGIDLRFDPQPDAGSLITGHIEALEPEGLTALTEAVTQAAQVLEYEQKPALIVLVTDGNETCGGSPCQVAAELSGSAKNLTVHVIGFQVRYSRFTNNDKSGDGATVAECLPALNGGEYVHADTVEDLSAALQSTLGCPTISQNGFHDFHAFSPRG